MKALMIVLVVLGIVLVVLGVVAAGAWWWVSRPPLYRASAMLLIEQPARNIGTLSELSDDSPPPLTNEILERECENLRNVGAPMLGADERFLVSPIPKTHLVEVVVIGPDPVASADRCNRIVDAYKEVVEGYADARKGTVRMQVINKADVPKARYR